VIAGNSGPFLYGEWKTREALCGLQPFPRKTVQEFSTAEHTLGVGATPGYRAGDATVF